MEVPGDGYGSAFGRKEVVPVSPGSSMSWYESVDGHPIIGESRFTRGSVRAAECCAVRDGLVCPRDFCCLAMCFEAVTSRGWASWAIDVTPRVWVGRTSAVHRVIMVIAEKEVRIMRKELHIGNSG